MTWRTERVIPAIVWIACGVYLATRLRYGWNPHDEGLLAQTAERVLRGELPHRDFDDAYTGGLAIYHAGVFRVLGTSLIALRVALLVAYVAWLPIVYWVARKFAAWGPATFVMAIVAVWSVPNRVAAMPSWYNLFLATAGAAALCRYLDTRRRGWLLAAGVAGGLSVLVKLTGLAYIAGALLVLVWDEQERDTVAPPAYSAFVTASLGIFIAVLARAVSRVPGISAQWHFVLPAACLAGVLIWRQWKKSTGNIGELMINVGTLIGGIAIPVAVFMIPYVASGSAQALVHGVIIAPGQRFQYAVGQPESLRTLWAIAPWVIVLTWRRTPAFLLGFALTVIIVFATRGGPAYGLTWLSIRHVAPVLVIAGTAAIARGTRRDSAFWVILCMTALTGLVQFPYAGSHYFSYFAAFPILCACALVRGTVPAIVGAFFCAFAVLCTNPAKFRINGDRIPDDQLPSVALDIPRTGLIVGTTEAQQYQRIVALVREHSSDSGYLFAAPDLPEIAFLAQRRNPTRILYDFLDEPEEHDARVLRTLDAKRVDVAVTGGYPSFSPPIDAMLAGGLKARYPDSVSVGPYTVRWRPPTTSSDVPNGR